MGNTRTSFETRRGKSALRVGGPVGTAASLLVLGMVLAGCSSVPDEINPVSWYKGVSNWVTGDEDQPSEQAANTKKQPEAPGANQAVPSLAQVPQKPTDVSSLEQRKKVMQGLAADREHAKYIDEAADTGTTAPAPASSKQAAAAPAPAEQPATTEASAAPQAPLEAPPAATSELAARAAGVGPTPIGAEAPASAPAPQATAAAAPPPAASEELALQPAAQQEAMAPAPMPPAAAGPAPGPVAAPGTGTVGAVYQAKLMESAPTVTTAPAGPTGPLVAANNFEDISPAAGGDVETEPSEGSVAFGESATFHSLRDFRGGDYGASSRVATINYAHGSARLNQAEIDTLREVVRMHKERGGTIRVVGFASSRTGNLDPVRHQMANFTVSMRRADVVARELMKMGVRPNEMYVGAVSDSEPIYFESMPAGEAANRRTEIFIDY